MSGVTVNDADDFRNDNGIEEEDLRKSKIPCYMIDPTSPITVFWDIFINLLRLASMMMTPFVFVFNYFSNTLDNIELVMDTLFCVDIVISLLKHRMGLHTLKENFIDYAYGFLFFDIIAVLPGLVFFGQDSLSFTKLVRIIYMSKIFKQFTMLFTKCLS